MDEFWHSGGVVGDKETWSTGQMKEDLISCVKELAFWSKDIEGSLPSLHLENEQLTANLEQDGGIAGDCRNWGWVSVIVGRSG